MSQGQFDAAIKSRLEQGAKVLDLQIPDNVSKQLLSFLSLLLKWNKAFNLTAVRDPMEMVERHLLDSLSILPYLQGSYILDIGTGPGLPGIPLALMRPQSGFVLLDSNSKKIRFVRQAVLELGLKNVQTVQARVESFSSESPFDTIVARAFTALPRMLDLTVKLHATNCRLLAMKGTVPQGEIDRLPPDVITQIIPLKVPYSEAERHLIVITYKG